MRSTKIILFSFQLDADFENQFPGKSSAFTNNWRKARKYLIHKLKDKNIKNPSHNGLVHVLDTVEPGIYVYIKSQCNQHS